MKEKESLLAANAFKRFVLLSHHIHEEASFFVDFRPTLRMRVVYLGAVFHSTLPVIVALRRVSSHVVMVLSEILLSRNPASFIDGFLYKEYHDLHGL